MTEPYYQADRVTLYLGDCIEVIRELPEASVDAIVTDPPYNLSFMNRSWDDKGGPLGFQQWCEAWAREAYRVLKPGALLVAFGGTRTHHRLVCGIEDAGFAIRDEADWMYGSGFPKSLDVSKAIDKAAGADRPDREVAEPAGNKVFQPTQTVVNKGTPVTDEAKRWQGWGTALKPAHEPICIARKPLSGNVAQNVRAYGTGALNIDGCRIESPDADLSKRQVNFDAMGYHGAIDTDGVATYKPGGRWPANVILDEEAAALLDATVGDVGDRGGGFSMQPRPTDDSGTALWSKGEHTAFHIGDRGGPSRFFYTAKASRSEREAGLDDLPPALRTDGRPPEGPGADNPRLRVSERRNDHPTVKPVAVMRWLVRLITPPGGVVLDPFLGSGTTGMAALDEGMRFIGIDMTERYVEIARYRVTHRHVIDHEVRPANEAIPQGRLL